MNKKIKQMGSDKKAKKDKKIIKVILWTFFWTLFLSQIFSAIFGWTIVDPILQEIAPPKIKIDPYPYPQLHDGKQWIRVNIINGGLSDIDPINVEYKLCYMDRFEKGKLHSNILPKKGGTDYFEIESNLNTNCSITTEPAVIYKDPKGRCYFKLIKNISKVCKYCKMQIKVFEGNNKIGELNYSYPFFEGELIMEVSGCKAYEEAENTSELTYVMEIFLSDPSTACLRRDIDRDWCEEQGYPTS